MIQSSSTCHVLMYTIIIDDTPDVSPYMSESLFKPLCLFFVFKRNTFVESIVFPVEKFYKITKLTSMTDLGIIQKGSAGVPQHR